MRKFLLLSCALFFAVSLSGQVAELLSPDGNLIVKIDGSSGQLRYAVYTSDNNVPFIAKSDIGLELGNGVVLGRNPKVSKMERKSVSRVVPAPFYRKSSVPDVYNELKIIFKGNYQVVFRAYNAGVAYRFVTSFKDSIVVKQEVAEFNFTEGLREWSAGRFTETEAYVPYVNRKPAANFKLQMSIFKRQYDPALYTICRA